MDNTTASAGGAGRAEYASIAIGLDVILSSASVQVQTEGPFGPVDSDCPDPFGSVCAKHSNSSVTLAAPSISEKWECFENETITPFTLGAGAFNAAVSQVTRSAPLYGRHPWPTAYPKRFGASIGDISSARIFGPISCSHPRFARTRAIGAWANLISWGHASDTLSAARSSPAAMQVGRLSVTDHCRSYQRGASYQISLKHCVSLVLPLDIDHGRAKIRRATGERKARRSYTSAANDTHPSSGSALSRRSRMNAKSS
jgi:hypothetical protein